MKNTVAVFGAYGHTGRFVVAELARRGLVPVAVGRDAGRLTEFGPDHETRVASAEDPASLDLALKGVEAVINTAGPFAVTAAPVIEAAVRAGIPYVDVAAEIEANADTFRHFSDVAITVLPAMAFFGGLGDLLVTAAMGDWTTADEAHVAYGLSSWQPTAGTLAAGAVSRDRRGGRRVRFTGGRLDYYSDTAELPVLDWDFPPPLGRRTVLAGFTMADVVTVPSHLAIPEVRTYMTTSAASDLAAGATAPGGRVAGPGGRLAGPGGRAAGLGGRVAGPGGRVAGPGGRVAETFTVDVIVRDGTAERRLTATGRDIYAVSAPLAVEAVQRILDGRTLTTGVASAGRLFDAADFLAALSTDLTVA